MTGEPPADAEETAEDLVDDDAFGRGARRAPLAIAIMIVLLLVGLAGVAGLVISVFGGESSDVHDARSPDGTLLMTVPDSWRAISDVAPGPEPGSTVFSLDASNDDGQGRAALRVLAPASGDPITELPGTLANLLADNPECTFGTAETIRDEAERAAIRATGTCESGPAVALAGATYTEDSRESWTVLVEGGDADPLAILDSVRIFGHDATGLPT